MFRIKIADLIIRIDNKYEYVSRLCDQYKVKAEEEDFAVSATEEAVMKEQIQEQGIVGTDAPAYCESLCLYREICLRIIPYDAFLMHSAVLEMDGGPMYLRQKAAQGRRRI